MVKAAQVVFVRLTPNFFLVLPTPIHTIYLENEVIVECLERSGLMDHPITPSKVIWAWNMHVPTPSSFYSNNHTSNSRITFIKSVLLPDLDPSPVNVNLFLHRNLFLNYFQVGFPSILYNSSSPHSLVHLEGTVSKRCTKKN